MFNWFKPKEETGGICGVTNDYSKEIKEFEKLKLEVGKINKEIDNLKCIDSIPNMTYKVDLNTVVNTNTRVILQKFSLENNAEKELKIHQSRYRGDQEITIYGSTIIELRDFLLKNFPLETKD